MIFFKKGSKVQRFRVAKRQRFIVEGRSSGSTAVEAHSSASYLSSLLKTLNLLNRQTQFKNLSFQ